MTETEHRLKLLKASPWEAVRMIADRLGALYNDTRDADTTAEHSGLVDGPELVAILAPMLELCEATLNIATKTQDEDPAPSAGMGGRLVERALGPSTSEVLDVLSATEHALQRERARVGWLAGLALAIINSIDDADMRAMWMERHGARLQGLVNRDAPNDDPDALPGEAVQT